MEPVDKVHRILQGWARFHISFVPLIPGSRARVKAMKSEGPAIQPKRILGLWEVSYI